MSLPYEGPATPVELKQFTQLITARPAVLSHRCVLLSFNAVIKKLRFGFGSFASFFVRSEAMFP